MQATHRDLFSQQVLSQQMRKLRPREIQQSIQKYTGCKWYKWWASKPALNYYAGTSVRNSRGYALNG